MTDSTSRRTRGKADNRPTKPYKKFPLYAHPAGYWAKKIRGKLHYFGRWGRVRESLMERIDGDTWKASLEIYNAQAEALHAGRTPRITSSDGLTVAELCNRFLTAKLRKMEAGELSRRSFAEYREFCDRVAAAFGKTRLVEDLAADDFESLRADAAKVWGPLRLGKFVQCVRTLFKYAFESGLIDRPVRFGPEFKRPSADVLRRHRAKQCKKLFCAEEIRRLLDAANPQLRAMIWLGVNCAFGNSDCAELPLSAVDLDSGWIDFPRGKTGIQRRCGLWEQTTEALKAAIAERPEPKHEADADCLFITRFGHRWGQGRTDSVGLEFGKLMRKLGINGRRGLGFYSLRHTFRTVADGTKDFPAIRCIMGHADSSIDATYREGIDDSRLVAVIGHVYRWLYADRVK